MFRTLEKHKLNEPDIHTKEVCQPRFGRIHLTLCPVGSFFLTVASKIPSDPNTPLIDFS